MHGLSCPCNTNVRMKIQSKNNDKIKHVSKLVLSSSYRRETGLFVLEGARLCVDAVRSDISPDEFYYTYEAKEKYAAEFDEISEKCENIYEIDKDIAAKISDTKSPQGFFTVNKALDKSILFDKINNKSKLVALDNVQNPDNLGAIARTAEAWGYDGLLIGSGCDIYNPKALRASMGAFFRLNIARAESLNELIDLCPDVDIIATVPDLDALSITDYIPDKGFVVVIGNEGNGISDDVLKRCNVKTTIKMKGRAESLNAATAAAIVLWELSLGLRV